MKVKVAILGIAGQMGRTLIRCMMAQKVPELELHGAVDLWDTPELGKDVGLMAGVGEKMGISVTCDLAAVGPTVDVIIDFSSHFSTAGNADRIAEWGVAWVIGTTGLNEKELAAVHAAAEKTAVVLSGNMSLGINLLCELVKTAARSLKRKGYDVEVLERHHNRKKDAPSGTALLLGRAAAEGYEWPLKEVQTDGRAGLLGKRPEKEIGFHAIRGGDIVGDHTVMLAGMGELLELSHRATNREVFAFGALQAAVWAAGKKAGLYGVKEVLGI